MKDGHEVLDLVAPLSEAATEDALLSEFAQRILQWTSADDADILVRSVGDGLVLRACTTAPEMVGRIRLGKGMGLAGTVLTTGRNIIVRRNLVGHRLFAEYPGLDETSFESALFVPMRGGARTEGVAVIRRTGPWSPSPAEVRRIERLVAAGSSIWLAYRAGYVTGSQSSRLGALSEVTKIITGSPYLEEILQLLVNITAQQFGYLVCTVRLLDEEHGELVLRATQSTAKAYQRKRAIKLGESIAGRAISANRAIVVRDVQEEEEYIGHDLAVEQGLHSMICVPLAIRDRPVGVMSCYSGEVRDFPPDEVEALETIAKQAAISIEHAKLQVRHTLMQEMHHRVKNNLQQVVSLLRLQLRQSHYKTLEEALNDSLFRILAISSVHDLLSREDLDHVGIRTIAESLVQHQQQSFLMPGKRIFFLVRGDEIRLNMTQATQIVLVLNELIQNAVEHGFERTDEGEIHITVEDRDGEVGVWVSNNGDALPPNFDPAVAGHLGLQIVENLTRGLGGTFKIGDVFGWTVAEVKFAKEAGE
ncbi:MAG TPA: GAF domain-containing protein [Fimbriimonadaceae bacterium]|nr:GAF domain-containing protein [Fimbriimonadaceae bacterium]HRJ97489.1 GAF domain-containing protein [Fimbriimonadaceae bacterium]